MRMFLCIDLGVKYIVAPQEAEQQIASLQAEDGADYIVAYDTDYVVLGCDNFVVDSRWRTGMQPRGLCNLLESKGANASIREGLVLARNGNEQKIEQEMLGILQTKGQPVFSTILNRFIPFLDNVHEQKRRLLDLSESQIRIKTSSSIYQMNEHDRLCWVNGS
ncbi:hypothetical protein SARC_05090 [Sphaeroforma arctica JP610]|uniref:XPG-I domain-containing protein n=1 Tax=Sphaeroforma arctica JP610 TaxID=667725 RepID=A0A0L0G1E1_9EUKA|nr:hypothetical protein SARC_05090 [Sphaeroforma arctica JP610]KNC82634.1 hypothetical protein SARC_05090 [Sphaeroforma arctica JP610]|eukprot:XP_014156536.1 hypothetical protein SARC_05090 [Sphaeroforma arctica JP610]